MSSIIDKIYKQIGGNDCNQDVSDYLSTGFLPLNKIISGKYNGGFPVGRITEVFGAESSGKTLLATMALIETQRRGGIAVFLDYEHAFSLSRAKKLGLTDDKESWIYKQPDTAESGFAMIEAIAKAVREVDSEKYITVVIDSVASMPTKEALDTDFGDENMRTKISLPMVMSTSLQKLAPLVSKTNITLIFLNQTRDNVGVMFGSKEKTTGGNALKFYASTRIKLSKTQKVKEGDKIIGEMVTAQVIKNKVFEPFGACEYLTNFAEGIDLQLSHIEDVKNRGLLGDTRGYVEFDGKKYRVKELTNLMKEDEEVYNKFLNEYFFKEVVK
jgi:protein RecA